MKCRGRGTVVSNPPTFGLRSMAGAGSSTGPLALGNLGAVGLFNDSEIGEWLIIWDLQIVVVPNPFPTGLIICDLDIAHGKLAGALSFPNSSSALISVGAQPSGSMWTFNANSNELGTVIQSISLIPAGTMAFYQWPHEWPIAAIAPGDSIVAYSDGNPYHDYGANYIYQVTTTAP